MATLWQFMRSLRQFAARLFAHASPFATLTLIRAWNPTERNTLALQFSYQHFPGDSRRQSRPGTDTSNVSSLLEHQKNDQLRELLVV